MTTSRVDFADSKNALFIFIWLLVKWNIGQLDRKARNSSGGQEPEFSSSRPVFLLVIILLIRPFMLRNLGFANLISIS